MKGDRASREGGIKDIGNGFLYAPKESRRVMEMSISERIRFPLTRRDAAVSTVGGKEMRAGANVG